MNAEDLEAYARQGEGQRIEFKLKVPEPEKMAREAVALANAQGGLLFFGIDDDGSIVGLKDPDEAEQFFQQAAEKLILPELEFSIERVPLNRKRSVVVVHIPTGKHKPYCVKDSLHPQRAIAYFRVEDKSIRASAQLFVLLKHSSRKEGTKFEYGEKEKKLMEYLDQHPSISLEEFSRHAGIRRFVAGRTLVMLTRAHVLRIEPGEKEDRYFRVGPAQ